MIEDNEIGILVDILRKNEFIPEDIGNDSIFKDGVLNLAGYVVVLKSVETPEDKTLIISFNIDDVNPYTVAEFMNNLIESGLKFV